MFGKFSKKKLIYKYMIKKFEKYIKEWVEHEEDLEEEDEEDLVDFITDDELRQFLIKHDALEKYLFNFETCNEDRKIFFDQLNRENYIIGAFIWDITPEGLNFWNNLHNLWLKYLRN